jgi:hypothetical protein
MRLLKSALTAVSVSGILLVGGATVAAAETGVPSPIAATDTAVTDTVTSPPAPTTGAVAPSTAATATPKAAVTPAPKAAVAPATKKDLDCKDFPNQAAAQAVYDADHSDPNRLDRDKDGKACESLTDGLTAAAQQQIPVKPSGGVDAGGSDQPLVPPLTALAVIGVFGTGAAAVAALRRIRRTS